MARHQLLVLSILFAFFRAYAAVHQGKPHHQLHLHPRMMHLEPLPPASLPLLPPLPLHHPSPMHLRLSHLLQRLLNTLPHLLATPALLLYPSLICHLHPLPLPTHLLHLLLDPLVLLLPPLMTPAQLSVSEPDSPPAPPTSPNPSPSPATGPATTPAPAPDNPTPAEPPMAGTAALKISAAAVAAAVGLFFSFQV